MQVHYLEFVVSDVDAQCAALEKAHGLSFGAPVMGLGGARVADLPQGGRAGVRAPMHDAEMPVVRPYVLTDDIAAALDAVTGLGAEILHPSLEIPGEGTFAIYQLGGVQQGFWQL